MHAAASGVLLGLNPLWLATVVMIVTYGVIISERLNRSIIALLGAMLMVMFGLLTQEQAVAGVDFNTIGLLVGMMVIVSITRKSGVFEYLAIWSAKLVKANPSGILAMLAVVTAVVSALLDNVTTVLLVVPVTLVITDDGRGFNPTQATGGMGLPGMRERVERLGGSLKVQSAPDTGTTICVTLPEPKSGGR